jgi:outer membrane lipoprotein
MKAWYSQCMTCIIRRYAVLAVILVGCTASPKVIPESLEAQIDKNVTFLELQDNPASHAGKTVVLGGEVLSAKRLRTGTLLEIFQIPLRDWQPTGDRTESQGRFLAFNKAGLDPAAIPPSMRVTVVGDVTGATKQALDESEYTYPTVEIRHIKVWEPRNPSDPVGGPRWGISIGGGTGVGVGGGIGIGF